MAAKRDREGKGDTPRVRLFLSQPSSTFHLGALKNKGLNAPGKMCVRVWRVGRHLLPASQPHIPPNQDLSKQMKAAVWYGWDNATSPFTFSVPCG